MKEAKAEDTDHDQVSEAHEEDDTRPCFKEFVAKPQLIASK